MGSAIHLSQRLADLEAAYQTCLVKALRECDSGISGLFGHNEHLAGHGKRPACVDELIEFGDTINTIRTKLGHDRFVLHDAFLAARGRKRENDIGEPQVARCWLQLREASSSPDRYPHCAPRQMEDKDA